MADGCLYPPTEMGARTARTAGVFQTIGRISSRQGEHLYCLRNLHMIFSCYALATHPRRFSIAHTLYLTSTGSGITTVMIYIMDIRYFACFVHNVAGAPPAAAATLPRSSEKKFNIYSESTNSFMIDILGNSPFSAGTK